MTPEQIAALGTLLVWLKDAGMLGAALLFIRMLLSGEIVTRRELDKAEAREAEWKRLALRGTDELIIPLTQEGRRQVREPRRETPKS